MDPLNAFAISGHVQAPHDSVAAMMEQGHGGLYAHAGGESSQTWLPRPSNGDTEIIQQHLERLVIREQEIEIYLIDKTQAVEDKNDDTAVRTMDQDAHSGCEGCHAFPFYLAGEVNAPRIPLAAFAHEPDRAAAGSA
jgi:hypothetical protein